MRCLTISLIGLVSSLVLADPPEAEALIKQLGDKRFTVREQATRKLWQLGPAVEPALRTASRDADVEVAMRAKSLLDKFAWGILFETPPAVITELEQFRDGDADVRRRAALALAELGAPGMLALERLRGKVEADDQRRMLNEAIALAAIRALPPLLKARQYDELQRLLESCLDRKADEAVANYVALVMLRGKLPAEIARWQAEHSKKPTPRSAEVLVALHRAVGDLDAARKLSAVRPDLLEDILWEQGNWAELAKLDPAEGTERRNPAVDRATRAAYCRLAGDAAGAAEHLEKLRALKDPAEEWTIAKGLLLNEKAADAIDRLSKFDPPSEIVFDLLVAQTRYREAFAWADKLLAAGHSERSLHLSIQRARALHLIGETDAAQQAFSAVAAKLDAASEHETAVALIQTQMRLGMRDAARGTAASFLGAVARQGSDSSVDLSRRIMEAAFAKRGGEAAAWWTHLRQKNPKDNDAGIMRQIVGLIDSGRPLPDGFEETIGALIGGAPADDAHAGVMVRLAAATAYEAHGQIDPAINHLSDAADRARTAKVHALNPDLRIGDLQAARQRYREAAEAYGRAADREPNEPLPLYLRGWALHRDGQAAAGDAVIDDARLLSLGDVRKRAVVAEELAKRDLADLARRERDLVVRLGWHRAWAAGSLLSLMARDAGARKDFARAAECYERIVAGLLASDFQFVENAGYLTVPAMAHAYRARAALVAGQFDAVRTEADACLTLTPGNLDLALLVVPELAKAGRKADADALYERVAVAYRELCRDQPQSAFAHNSIAWLAACCRRDLDDALSHAKKATELAPKNAGHRDTLAEVMFQRGDRAQALLINKECRRMDPNNLYFVKQMQRFEAGDPSVPPPPETEDN